MFTFNQWNVMKRGGKVFFLFLIGFSGRSSRAGLLWETLVPGARHAALAEADTALSNNENGLFHNPAALAQIQTPSLHAQSTLGLEDTRLQALGVVWATPRATWGVAATHASAGTIDVIDISGFSLGSVDAQTEVSGSLAAAAELHRFNPALPHLALGAAVRYLSENIAETGADPGHALDLGALYPLWGNRAALGVSAHNLFCKIGEETLPRFWSLGAALHPWPHQNGSFTFDLSRRPRGETSPRAGVEYTVQDILTLRAGYMIRNRGNRDQWATGLGFRLPLWGHRVQMDYAYRSADPLGGMHSLDVAFHWREVAP